MMIPVAAIQYIHQNYVLILPRRKNDACFVVVAGYETTTEISIYKFYNLYEQHPQGNNAKTYIYIQTQIQTNTKKNESRSSMELNRHAEATKKVTTCEAPGSTDKYKILIGKK